MLKRQYIAAGSTRYQARHSMLLALMVYAGSCLWGWMYADALNFFQGAASQLAGKFAGKTGLDFIFALFLHNLVATYITVCLLIGWGSSRWSPPSPME